VIEQRRIGLAVAMCCALVLVACSNGAPSAREQKASAALAAAEQTLPVVDGVSQTLRYVYDKCAEDNSVPPQVILSYASKSGGDPSTTFRAALQQAGWQEGAGKAGASVSARTFDGVPVELSVRNVGEKSGSDNADPALEAVTFSVNLTVGSSFSVCN
jgi:hypothetical protein